MDFIVIDGKLYSEEKVQEIVLRNIENDLSDASTILEEEKSDGWYTLEDRESVNEEVETVETHLVPWTSTDLSL